MVSDVNLHPYKAEGGALKSAMEALAGDVAAKSEAGEAAEKVALPKCPEGVVEKPTVWYYQSGGSVEVVHPPRRKQRRGEVTAPNSGEA